MLGSIPTYQFLQWMEVSGRLEAGARVFSSSGWENPDAGKHTNVPIPPVDGGFRTFGGRCAGVFLQWVEVFGL